MARYSADGTIRTVSDGLAWPAEAAGEAGERRNGEQEAKTINMFLLNLFFIKPYEPEQDFYEQYEERRAMAGQAGLK